LSIHVWTLIISGGISGTIQILGSRALHLHLFAGRLNKVQGILTFPENRGHFPAGLFGSLVLGAAVLEPYADLVRGYAQHFRQAVDYVHIWIVSSLEGSLQQVQLGWQNNKKKSQILGESRTKIKADMFSWTVQQ
jgi:hypothetical protein